MRQPLPWIHPGEPLPEAACAWRDPNGLLAAGADLSAARLLEAYRKGIFPWYTEGQPVLWWSPDPRMVLLLPEFRLRRSLAKTIRRFAADPAWQLTMNTCFETIMRRCAAPRPGRTNQAEPGCDPDVDRGGTWITDAMLAAYADLHRLGHAHSVELWHGQSRPTLVAGLYGVSIGRMFYGESMFTQVADGSKVALAALVYCLREADFHMIDCQQNTQHLASLGAREIAREQFLGEMARLGSMAAPDWTAMSIGFPRV